MREDPVWPEGPMADNDIIYSERPTLRKPILIVAFEGWNDAAEAATSAVEHLQEIWDATSFATLDPEEFYDFTEVRPTVRMVGQNQRQIDWPTNEFFYHRSPEHEQDFILLLGVEPSLKWRRFTEAIIKVAREAGVTTYVSLGALLSDVPHGREARVTVSATDPKLRERIGRVRGGSRYEGPTGIVGVLHDAFTKAGIVGASMWGHAPHYLSASPNPVVTLGILRRLAEIFELELDLQELEGEATTFVSQVNEAVSRDPEASSYIHQLESQSDEDEDDDVEPTPRHPSTGKSLIEDVEDFLRKRFDKD
jgi:proteasome assembly chaperone (PAC2) family protein